MKKICFYILICCLINFKMSAAFLNNVPTTIIQPDSTTIYCYLSGDDCYSWLHDEDHFTIIQDTLSGVYYYADSINGSLVCSAYEVGKVDPDTTYLIPNINISYSMLDEILAEFDSISSADTNYISQPILKAASLQSLNNLVIYIKFSGQSEFSPNQAHYTQLFNSNIQGDISLRNYFNEVTYTNLDILSTFYPSNNGVSIISYEDPHPIEYYKAQSSSNPIGYKGFFERKERENELVENAVVFIQNQIPTNLNLDINNDGNVDGLCFILNAKHDYGIFWPHKWTINSDITINGSRIYNYIFMVKNCYLCNSVATYCHEMYHALGAPDLYRYNGFKPIGDWGLMGSSSSSVPVHMSTYMKYKYGRWITEIPEITKAGTYNLNPITHTNNNCYKISLFNTNEYLVLEFRKAQGYFESFLPGSGLLVYKINEKYRGNLKNGGSLAGDKDEVFLYRNNGDLYHTADIDNAHLSQLVNRSSFNKTSNPFCYLKDGTLGDIHISEITDHGNYVTFKVDWYCNGTDIRYENTDNLPRTTRASSSISTRGNVMVKKDDQVKFLSVGSILLDKGFEIQSGGIFEANKLDHCY